MRKSAEPKSGAASGGEPFRERVGAMLALEGLELSEYDWNFVARLGRTSSVKDAVQTIRTLRRRDMERERESGKASGEVTGGDRSEKKHAARVTRETAARASMLA